MKILKKMFCMALSMLILISDTQVYSSVQDLGRQVDLIGTLTEQIEVVPETSEGELMPFDSEQSEAEDKTEEDLLKPNVAYEEDSSNPINIQESVEATNSAEEWIEVPGIQDGKILFDYSTGRISNSEKSITVANIPSEIDGTPVTSIGNSAFTYCRSLTEVSIPGSVKVIEYMAFYYCSNLVSLKLNEGVESIFNGAFGKCSSLKSVVFPPNMKHVGYALFTGCNLDSIKFQGNVETVDGAAFEGATGLSNAIVKNIIIGSEMSAINIPIIRISTTDSITVMNDNEHFSSYDGVLYDKNKTILFGSPRAKEGNHSIPNSVITIKAEAFRDSHKLTGITIPNSVETIENMAFRNCDALTELVIPNSVNELGNEVFRASESLTSVTIGTGVKVLGYYSFYYCSSLKYITIPNGLEELGNNAFGECASLEEITIPDSVKIIDRNLFYNCISLKTVNLPESVDEINAESMFYNCNKLTSVVLPNPTTPLTYNGSAFANCTSLSSVTLPQNTKYINGEMFLNCTSLQEIYIPEMVERAYVSSFTGCSSLQNILVNENNTALLSESGVLFNKNKTTIMVYPAGKTGDYSIPDGVTKIGETAFQNCIHMTALTIANSVTFIDEGAFSNCDALTEITIHSGVTQMEPCGLSSCDLLKDIYYLGNESQWNSLYPHTLEGKTIHFLQGVRNYVSTHSYILTYCAETLMPLKTSKVTIDGADYTSDENGVIELTSSFGEKTILVSSDGYKDRKYISNIEKGAIKSVYLEKQTDNLPYITMAINMKELVDVRETKSVHYIGKPVPIAIKTEANWMGQTEGEYAIYQIDENGKKKYLTNSSGSFAFAPSVTFLTPNSPIYIELILSDGTHISAEQTQFEIKDTVNNSVTGGALQDGKLRLPTGSGSVDNEDIGEIFPTDFKLDFDLIPLNIEIEHDEQTGETKNICSFGFSVEEGGKWGPNWANVKEVIDKGEKLTDVLSTLKNTMNVSGKSFGAQAFVKDKTEFGVIGYLELVYDANGNPIADKSLGKIMLDLNLKSKLTSQFLLGPVPLYFDLKTKLESSAGGTIKIVGQNAVDFGLEWTLTPEIVLGLGAGISGLASVGVEGALKAKVDVLPESKAAYEAAAKVVASALFVFKYEWKFAKIEGALWGYAKQYSVFMNMADEIMAEEPALSVASRDYAEKTTQWNGSTAAMHNTRAITPSSTTNLQEWIMPNSMPEILEVSGEKIIIFQSDAIGKSTGNNVNLMYSVYDESKREWSLPNTVSDKDTMDMSYKAYVANDTLYVIYQKLSANTTQTETGKLMEEMIGLTDIAVSTYNISNKGFDTNYIVTKDMLDLQPVLAIGDNKISAVWLTNSENDLLGGTGNSVVMKSDFVDGAWSSATQMYESEIIISELVAGYNGSELEILCAMLLGEGVPNVYEIKNGKAVVIEGQESLGYSFTNIGNMVYWYAQGKVFEYNLLTKELNPISAGGVDIISPTFKLVGNSMQTSLIWSENEEDENGVAQSKIYATIKNSTDWSEPVELLSSHEYLVSYMDAVLEDDLSWSVIMNTNSLTEEGKSNLSYSNIRVKNDIDLVYANSLERELGVNTQKLVLEIANSGQEEVKSFNIVVTDGVNEIYNQVHSQSIEVGKSKNVEINVDVSSVVKETDLNISISTENELDYTLNTGTVKVGETDVKVDCSQIIVGNNVVLKIPITNTSDIPANVSFQITEDTIDGKVVASETIENLTHEDLYEYTHIVDTKNIVFSKTDSKYYFIKITSAQYDKNQYDNEAIAILYKEEESAEETGEEKITLTPVASISTAEKIEIDMGKSIETEIVATIIPNSATNKGVIWTSSNNNIATVNENGIVTAVAEGNATITATTSDGGFISTTVVTVIEEIIRIYEITFDYSYGEINSVLSTDIESKINNIPIPTRKGYNFIGWYTAAVDGQAINTETKFTENTTVYAVWQEQQFGILGDVNKNGLVDMEDLYQISAENNYNKSTSNIVVNPNTDVNNDGVVNFLDIALSRNSKYFGKVE